MTRGYSSVMQDKLEPLPHQPLEASCWVAPVHTLLQRLELDTSPWPDTDLGALDRPFVKISYDL